MYGFIGRDAVDFVSVVVYLPAHWQSYTFSLHHPD